MTVTNKALLMKLWWSIRSSNKKWARFLWAKFTTRTERIKLYGVRSSTLPRVRMVHDLVDKKLKFFSVMAEIPPCTMMYGMGMLVLLRGLVKMTLIVLSRLVIFSLIMLGTCRVSTFIT